MWRKSKNMFIATRLFTGIALSGFATTASHSPLHAADVVCLCVCAANPVGAGLPAMQATRCYSATVRARLKVTGPPCTYPAFAFNWNYGFALTASPFCQTATKGTKKASPHRTALASLRCPSLRSCSVGTPPRAIHGPSRLSRHPCRSTHSTEPPLGLPKGRQIKSLRGGRPAGLFCVGVRNPVVVDELREAVLPRLQPPAQHIQQVATITQ